MSDVQPPPPSPLATLPPEIVQEILEQAALEIPRTISLVNSIAHQRALPVTFSTVSLKYSRKVTEFLDLLKASDDARDERPNLRTSLSTQVKNLAIHALGPLDVIAQILGRCICLQNILFACSTAGLQLYHPVLPLQLREQHMIGLSNRDGVVFSCVHPTVRKLHVQISHRDLISLRNVGDQLLDLTHLAVSLPSTAVASWDTVIPELTKILDNNPRLEVCFIQVARSSSAGSMDPTTSRMPDPRIVIFHAPLHLADQWDKATYIPGGIWAEAENRVKLRKKRIARGSSVSSSMPGSGTNSRAGSRRSSTVGADIALLRQTFAGLKRMTLIEDDDALTDSE